MFKKTIASTRLHKGGEQFDQHTETNLYILGLNFYKKYEVYLDEVEEQKETIVKGFANAKEETTANDI